MKKNNVFPSPQFIVDETGKKTQVVLDVDAYNKLIELIEDLSLSKMAQSVLDNESRDEYVALDELRDLLITK
jgi:hypothetical protein